MELAPLTILFGANGAGKSTILDAIGDAKDCRIVATSQNPFGFGLCDLG